MEFRYKETARVSEGEISDVIKVLEPYCKHMQEIVEKRDYSAPEASLCLSGDENIFAEVKVMLERHPPAKLKCVFLIGIGGSNLGTKAIYDALRGQNEMFASTALPKIIFLDTISSRELEVVTGMIRDYITSMDEVLVNIVSKSGMTLETIVNAEIILAALKRKFGDISKQVVVTTDKGSKLDEWASDMDMDALHIPRSIGGRYSVFSAVGLFPLGLCGFKIEEFVAGAKFIVNTLSNPEGQLLNAAAVQFINYKKGKVISDNFFFAPELESLGKWTRQLVAESLGKSGDAGFLPTVSIGSTDLHSMAQLYLGGPQNIYSNFISIESLSPMAVPVEVNFKFLDVNITNKSIDSLSEAIIGGTQAAYAKLELPFSEIVLHGVSEQSLGEYMQFKMIETMLLGSLMNINAFDQPAVEEYKMETRKLLE